MEGLAGGGEEWDVWLDKEEGLLIHQNPKKNPIERNRERERER